MTDIAGLGSSKCWAIMGIDASVGWTACCSPGARRSSQCWPGSYSEIEAQCCGADLVDENPAKLPAEKVRRFDTALAAKKLGSHSWCFVLIQCWCHLRIRMVCSCLFMFSCHVVCCVQLCRCKLLARNIHYYLHSHQVRSNPGGQGDRMSSCGRSMSQCKHR